MVIAALSRPRPPWLGVCEGCCDRPLPAGTTGPISPAFARHGWEKLVAAAGVITQQGGTPPPPPALTHIHMRENGWHLRGARRLLGCLLQLLLLHRLILNQPFLPLLCCGRLKGRQPKVFAALMMTYSFSHRTTLKLAAPRPRMRLLKRLELHFFFFFFKYTHRGYLHSGKLLFRKSCLALCKPLNQLMCSSTFWN